MSIISPVRPVLSCVSKLCSYDIYFVALRILALKVALLGFDAYD